MWRLLNACSTASNAPAIPSEAARRACSRILSDRSASMRHSLLLMRMLMRSACWRGFVASETQKKAKAKSKKKKPARQMKLFS